MRIRRRLPVLLLALGVSGCGSLIEMAGNSAGLPSPSKLVESKVRPDVLIADDGSRCRVPRARFEAIEPGDYVTCVWDRP